MIGVGGACRARVGLTSQVVAAESPYLDRL